MANKTIYVPDESRALFERAQELSGENLSATIAIALGRFVASQEAYELGYEEVTLQDGDSATPRYKRFVGARIGVGRRDAEDGSADLLTVYRTPRGKIVLHTWHVPDWAEWHPSGSTDDAAAGWRGGSYSAWTDSWASWDWIAWQDSSRCSLEVVDSVDDLGDRLPETLRTSVREAAQRPLLEVLDI